MGKKSNRRSILMDIQDQLDCFNMEYNLGDAEEKASIEENIANSEIYYLILSDFITTASFCVKGKRKRRKKKITSSNMEVYEGPMTRRVMNDKRIDVSCFKPTFYTSHNLSKDTFNYLKDLQSSRSYLHFSRLGKSLRGSTKILVSKYKIAFLLLWNVGDKKYNFRLVPLLNCSSIENSTICNVFKTFPNELTEQFEKQINGKISINQDDEHLFCLLSGFICSNERHISTAVTKKLLYLATVEGSKKSPLENILKKANKVLIDRSKDYFDIYASSNYDCEYPVKDLREGESLDADNVCPICFDIFDNDDIQIMTCGHKACASCWKQLIKVSSSSIDVPLRCPAIKCNTELTVRDAAHLLFDESEGICLRNVNEISSLIRLKIDKAIMKKKVKYCSTPSCNCIFTEIHKNNNEEMCTKVSLCECGVSICQDCGYPAHFGITCSAAKRLRDELESNRLQSDLMSLIWLQKNTSPCPRCLFPINKDGGCNHVGCSKCGYYFCWKCGGPGNSCGAFFCKNTSTFAKDDIDLRSRNDHLSSQVASIRNFSRSVSAFNGLTTKYANSEDKNDQMKRQELQLRSMLMWVRGASLVKALSGTSTQVGNDDIHKIESSLELTLCKLTGRFNKNKIKAMMNFKDYVTKPSTKHPKQQKKEVSMHEIFEFDKLQDMNNKELDGHISSLLRKSIALLLPTSTNGKNKQKASKATEENELSLLNQRRKVLQSSWKGERRFDAPKSIEEKSKTSWKGKVRVTTRRNFALSLNDL